jgi:glycogen debranching enzyme
MDAKVGDWVVTPRIGKPVEIQALWINALRIAKGFTEEFAGHLRTATESFEDRFWNAEGGGLYDVVDVDHVAGAVDGRFRPNQIFAVGGLPHPLVDPQTERARRIVDAVEARLLTPLGLRTLSREDPGYCPRYAGGVLQRDGAYHQGTAWPWLAGAFVDAWVRVRGGTEEAKNEARARFLAPLVAHLDQAGLSHVSEVADGDPPHAPGGCPFQAWSVGESLRIDRVILAPSASVEPERPTSRKRRTSTAVNARRRTSHRNLEKESS